MNPRASREEILSTIQEAGIDLNNIDLSDTHNISFQNSDEFTTLYRHLASTPQMIKDRGEEGYATVFLDMKVGATQEI